MRRAIGLPRANRRDNEIAGTKKTTNKLKTGVAFVGPCPLRYRATVEQAGVQPGVASDPASTIFQPATFGSEHPPFACMF
jgi:hypothetical protein